MFITKTLQPATSPPSHQQISMPVSHKKQSPVGLLTSDRPFFQPVTNPVEMPVASRPVSQSSSQKPATSVAVYQ